MAASKSKNTGHSGRNTKKKTAMEQEVGRFQTEIILFVILAACVILMASNFGAGGCGRCDQQFLFRSDGTDGISVSNRIFP